MPRLKSYKIDKVLAAATALFLKRGYEASSLNELVTVTGLNRHSMYKEFGDKEGLFLACLKYYTFEERNLKTVEILTRQPLGLKNIEEFLEDRIDYALSDDCHGCLLVNTVTEREVVSQRINGKVDKIISNQENLILKCVEAAIENNEISDNHDSRAMTDYLSCFFRGIMNMGKNPNKKKSSLKVMGPMALSAITR